MSNLQATKLPIWFWIIAGLALLWNLAGAFAYWSDVSMSEEAIAALPDAQKEMRAATPSWLVAVYAIAVFAGVLGSAALLFRKVFASPLFITSFAAIVLQMGYVIFVLGATTILFPAIVVGIGGFLVWFSSSSKSKGWLH